MPQIPTILSSDTTRPMAPEFLQTCCHNAPHFTLPLQPFLGVRVSSLA